ncbi:MAG: hypothetical protein KDE04_13310, partial [Anaerolineales bacterium]|nr:hypothetical protein [Anaerolineales bacterium]
MLSEAERNQVVAALLEANQTKIQTTRPSALFPHIQFEDSYAISAAVAEATLAAGASLIGYKVGLTSVAMRRSSKIDEPDYGYLYDHFLLADGAKVAHANYCVPRVELELAFILGQPLRGPGVGLLDVMRATEYVVPAIEIIDTRVDEPRQIFDTIADNGAG